MTPSAMAAVVGFVASAVAAPLVYRILLRLGSRQTVSQHVPEHAEKQGTPTMGGLIVLVGVAAALVGGFVPGTAPIAALLLGFGLVGFLDDFLVPRWMPGKRGLGWMPKLGLEFAAVGAALATSGRTDPASIVVGGFLVLFFSNAYNFSDGMDGLAGGLAVLLAAGLGALFIAAGTGGATLPLLAAIATSFLPFLALNIHPAKVFMGDVGALPIGAVFGWSVFVEAWPAQGPALALPLAVVSLVMLVELVPVPLQIASAKLRKGKRLFPFRTPVHHAFQHAGWPETRVVSMFWAAQALCGLAATLIARGTR
jgi:phospho-N-acetylmuramoyl-pentapeptide-transferase